MISGVYDKWHKIDERTRTYACDGRPCLVVKLTFVEICGGFRKQLKLDRYVPPHILDLYCDFFEYAERYYNVDRDDAIYVVLKWVDGYWHDVYVNVYIYFQHFEYCSPLAIMELMGRLEELCRYTGCIYAYLWDFACGPGYIVFKLLYPEVLKLRRVPPTYRRSPWKKLLLYMLSDYLVSSSGLVSLLFEEQ